MSRTTTDRRPRLPKPAARAWAWVAGALSFFASWAMIGLDPKPGTEQSAAVPRSEQPHPQVIVIRRVIIEEIPVVSAPSIRYVVGASSGSSSSGGGGGNGGGGYSPPPPPPVVSSGGS